MYALQVQITFSDNHSLHKRARWSPPGHSGLTVE